MRPIRRTRGGKTYRHALTWLTKLGGKRKAPSEPFPRGVPLLVPDEHRRVGGEASHRDAGIPGDAPPSRRLARRKQHDIGLPPLANRHLDRVVTQAPEVRHCLFEGESRH